MGLFITYPISVLLRLLPNVDWLKHSISLLTGIIFLQWIYEDEWIHALFSSSIAYVLCLLLPRRYAGPGIFLWSMSYILLSQIFCTYAYYSVGKFDFTRTQMVITMKMTSFAYSYSDGDPIGSRNVNDGDPRLAKLNKVRLKYAIQILPNLLEYFSYVLSFNTSLVGPSLEFNEYIFAIKHNSLWTSQSSIDSVQAGVSRSKNSVDRSGTDRSIRIPPSFLLGLQQCLNGIICLVIYLLISSKVPTRRICELDFIRQHSWYYRLLYTYISLIGERFKYYFVWKVSEGGCIIGGFGYESYQLMEMSQSKELADNAIDSWDAASNVNIYNVEFAANFQTLTRNWNQKTSRWLEKYTYLRTNKSLFVTYLVSALWHGIHPGFFLFFLSVPIITEIERLIRLKINPLIPRKVILDQKGPQTASERRADRHFIYPWWYNVLSWAGAAFALNYTAQVSSVKK